MYVNAMAQIWKYVRHACVIRPLLSRRAIKHVVIRLLERGIWSGQIAPHFDRKAVLRTQHVCYIHTLLQPHTRLQPATIRHVAVMWPLEGGIIR